MKYISLKNNWVIIEWRVVKLWHSKVEKFQEIDKLTNSEIHWNYCKTLQKEKHANYNVCLSSTYYSNTNLKGIECAIFYSCEQTNTCCNFFTFQEIHRAPWRNSKLGVSQGILHSVCVIRDSFYSFKISIKHTSLSIECV